MVKEDKREAILQATLELVAENGFHDAPCSAIAERAGVAAGTIYRYFENKDVLIGELYHTLESRITADIMVGYDPAQPVRERFMHLGQVVLPYFIDNPQQFKFIEQFHHSPYGAAFRRDRILGPVAAVDETCKCNLYRELFNEGVARQVIKDLPMPVLFDLAFGPIVFTARNHILGFIRLDLQLIKQVVAACWDGLSR